VIPTLYPSPADWTPDALQARVLHRDGLVIVLDKPAGLPVHSGPKGGPNLAVLLPHLSFGLPRPPKLAHRLDKDTSGCLVLARHPKAWKLAGDLFAQSRARKTYWAVVEGEPDDEAGTIELPLAPKSPDRGWWMKVDEAGQPATTHWRVLGRGTGEGRPFAWMELQPVTGRTHQLRVHAAAMGWPIVGDAVYGTADRFSGPPMQLHARRIELPLSKTGAPLAVEAPVPRHMAGWLSACGATDQVLSAGRSL
jgi:tRNA pseudouridine32 synthase/23S rRNA pseudouridine746 synthase